MFALVILSLCFYQPLNAQSNANTFSFAVVGDVPYGKKALARFPELVHSIESSSTDFGIHIGDIKAGSASCSDEMLSSRIQAIDAINKPMVYVPGDNDWTDCHRRRAGRFNPLERLDFLRRQAFSKPGHSLGQPPMQVDTQATETGFQEFPEHQRWSHNNTAFMTIHVLGSANGFEGFSGRIEADDAEVKRRIQASIQWLQASMAQAIAGGASAAVVAIHGNPLDFSESRAARYDIHPYEGIMSELKQQAAKFNKPLLLIHGDTHKYRFDQPFANSITNETITNLYRLEGIGDPAIGWVEVTVDSNSQTPFRTDTHFIKQ